MNGRADGYNHSQQMVEERYAIWHDPEKSFSQKVEELKTTGVDLGTIAAMAMVGGMLGVVNKNFKPIKKNRLYMTLK